ncbi:hypothetical protein JQ628_33775 [Bradyrhizobium lablabi]|uniref:hypothetical protein n=1 Tax=Bradyrhizobium lablabi TaxID=722472 RepID=UPI001BA83DDB|nr:hypothetical protein [Bradyrhizobium lablabi]MBR1126532.1 hypothetical protein [Bradyrhizobium lablabi]
MVGFPLLLIPLAIYNCVAFLMPTVSFTEPLFKIPLVSGVEWPVTLSDVLIALGIVLLLLEVIKGARPGAKFLTDHLLSFIVFAAAAAEFVLWPKFGTSTFLLLTLLSLVDFLTGISLRTRRRAVLVYEDAPVRRQRRAPAVEPEAEAAPASAPKPVPAPAAETDRFEPGPVQPPAPAVPPPSSEAAASPEVASPTIQPANDAHPSPDKPQR